MGLSQLGLPESGPPLDWRSIEYNSPGSKWQFRNIPEPGQNLFDSKPSLQHNRHQHRSRLHILQGERRLKVVRDRG
jgi:hypothetical protein